MSFIRPTESELEILQILWDFGPSSVKFVNDKLNEKKETRYTTTLKLMQIMHEKMILEREKEGKGHIYNYLVKESDIKNILVEKIITTIFEGSASNLVLHALENKKTTKKELEKIKELIEKLENQR